MAADERPNLSMSPADGSTGALPRFFMLSHFAALRPSRRAAAFMNSTTCRMGHDPKKSVLNNWNQSHDINNLFMDDGSTFVNDGYQNPTMTILSPSMRASEYLAENLRTAKL